MAVADKMRAMVANPVRPLSDRQYEELDGLLGPGSVGRDEAARSHYGRDETEDLLFPPDVVVWPGSAGEVAAVMAWANRNSIAVTPRGAGTGLSGGALPVRGGVCLSLERMNRIRSIDPRDMVAEVEAGVPTEQLIAEAARLGLLYGPNPSSLDQCTLGGNIAENAAGPLSLRYGTTRDQVLGLEVVLADGRRIETGGRNRKDVAGYDLNGLLVGSEGTLGIVTAATLKLHPAPRVRTTLLVAFPTLESAATAVEVLCREVPGLAACEIVDGQAIQAVDQMESVPEPLSDAGAALILEIHLQSAGEPEQVAEGIYGLVEPLGVDDLQIALDTQDERKLWRIRRQVAHAVKAISVYKEVDTVVPRSKLADLVRAARQAADNHGLTAICYGHAGDGNLHINLLRGDLDDLDWATARDAAETELLDATRQLGGSITGEHGIGWTQRDHLARLTGPTLLEQMRRIKKTFDPTGILNPDKIFLAETVPDRGRPR